MRALLSLADEPGPVKRSGGGEPLGIACCGGQSVGTAHAVAMAADRSLLHLLLVILVRTPRMRFCSRLSHTNWAGFRETLPERLDRLIGQRRMPPVVVAFPDCFTRLGGNQYINSASLGAWGDFLLP